MNRHDPETRRRETSPASARTPGPDARAAIWPAPYYRPIRQPVRDVACLDAIEQMYAYYDG